MNNVCVYIYIYCTRGEQTLPPPTGRTGPMPTPIAIWAHSPQSPRAPRYAQIGPSGVASLLGTKHCSARVTRDDAGVPRAAVPCVAVARVCRPPCTGAPTSSTSGWARPPCLSTYSRRCSSILGGVVGVTTVLVSQHRCSSILGVGTGATTGLIDFQGGQCCHVRHHRGCPHVPYICR
jgi:hypothetical protein